VRININTNGKVKDTDIRALYLLVYAIDNSTPRMKTHNLTYLADRMGFKIVKKEK